MLRLIFVELWPAFIPLALYLLWQLRRRHAARKQGLARPHLLDGPWVWALMLSLAGAIIGFFILGMSNPHNSGTHYQPTEFINGTLKKEHFD